MRGDAGTETRVMEIVSTRVVGSKSLSSSLFECCSPECMDFRCLPSIFRPQPLPIGFCEGDGVVFRGWRRGRGRLSGRELLLRVMRRKRTICKDGAEVYEGRRKMMVETEGEENVGIR